MTTSTTRALRSLTAAAALCGAFAAAPSFAQAVETTDTTTTAQTPATTTTTQTTTTTTQNGTTQNGQATATTSSNLITNVSLTPAANNDRRRFTAGPEFGIYMPMSSKTRNSFGQAWFNVGVGLGSLTRPDPRGQFTADLNLFGVSRGGGRDVLMAPIGLNYRRALSPYARYMPYAGVGADLVVTQLHSAADDVQSRLRGTYAASAFTGISFKDRGYLQARYYFMAPTRGYDLSGLSITTGYRF